MNLFKLLSEKVWTREQRLAAMEGITLPEVIKFLFASNTVPVTRMMMLLLFSLSLIFFVDAATALSGSGVCQDLPGQPQP